MFIPYSDSSIRLTGRFYTESSCVSTTACGSYIEASVYGDWAILHFNMTDLIPSYPAVYISIDGGDYVGSAIGARLFLRMKSKDFHTIKVILKGACEKQNRWYAPIQAKMSFEGIEADRAGTLTEDNRKVIYYIGDSITEGILIHPEQQPFKNNNMDRVYQDDVTRTYAWITAEALNLRPVFTAYGAVGMTKSGSGAVPKVSESFPFCIDKVPYVEGVLPDYILINHGCNDRGHAADEYCESYSHFLDLISMRYPHAVIFVLSAFIGAHVDALNRFVRNYNHDHKTNIVFINSSGWVSENGPTHPLEDGHIAIAEHLIPILEKHLLPESNG